MLRRVRTLARLLRNLALLPQIAADVRRLTGEPGKTFVPAGHFYSPIPDPSELLGRWPELSKGRDLRGINLDEAEQLTLLNEVLDLGGGMGLPQRESEGWRYHADNVMFGLADATILAGMLLRFQPKRIIEVGSGFSSALTLDVRERAGLDCQLTFIDPFPQRLLALLRPSDNACRIIETAVQDVDLSTFDQLEAGDFLFIDSTHVAKTGSDVLHEFFEIIPRLRSGVIVHLHDVFYPFEYPAEWALKENRAWNELYFLRAFLMDNPRYEVLLFPHMFAVRGVKRLTSLSPGVGSFWMRKL